MAGTDEGRALDGVAGHPGEAQALAGGPLETGPPRGRWASPQRQPAWPGDGSLVLGASTDALPGPGRTRVWPARSREKQSAFTPCSHGTLRNGPCPRPRRTGWGGWTPCKQNTEAPAGERQGRGSEAATGARAVLRAKAPGPRVQGPGARTPLPPSGRPWERQVGPTPGAPRSSDHLPDG